MSLVVCGSELMYLCLMCVYLWCAGDVSMFNVCVSMVCRFAFVHYSDPATCYAAHSAAVDLTVRGASITVTYAKKTGWQHPP